MYTFLFFALNYHIKLSTPREIGLKYNGFFGTTVKVLSSSKVSDPFGTSKV